MYDKLGYGWGNSLLGFLALALGIPFPILIYRVILVKAASLTCASMERE
jgi:hypothetical protein